MGKLWRALNHAGMALFVFVAVTGVFLWSTGSLRIGVPGPAAHSEDDGHDHVEHSPGGDDHRADHTEHDHEEGEGHEHEADWCAQHGVPEAACTKCDPALVAQFKAKGDWCAEHDLPESQCETCNPGCRAKLEAARGSPQANPSTALGPGLADLERRQCEHGKPILTCDECRYQVGVVKVQPAVAKALLKTEKVERRQAVRTLRLTGEVQLDRTRVVNVPPTASGRVVEVKAFLGDRVSRGDVLAVVHSGDFGEAKAAYLGAHTEFEIARREQERQAALVAALDRLLEHLATVNGDSKQATAHRAPEVPKGLVGEWKAKLLGAAARLRLADINHEREKGLWEKGISSKAEHDDAHQEWETAQAEYAALVEEVDLSLSLEKLRADSAVRKAEAALRAAEQKLHIFGLDGAAIRSLREAKDNGDFARLAVKAPRPGTVIAQDASEGRFVETSHALFTIADLSNLWVWCDVYERDLAALQERVAGGEAVPATVRVAAFPNAAFRGSIDLVGSTLDEHTRTVKVRVQVANQDGRLKPGMFATVDVEVRSGEEVAVVPREALLSDDGKTFVFQHWRDDFWVRRDVTVGDSDGPHVAILSGLPEGATIVAGGGFMLKSDVLRSKMGAG